jgi:hypothetical protein
MGARPDVWVHVLGFSRDGLQPPPLNRRVALGRKGLPMLPSHV